ncbi:hypothetical protein HMPREF1051_1170 [Neisseria sicca VK64]|uniref:Uncharacterized protein n=1 Tax=Neisseria sicca VK64 TaxID=1095748 RepID=I2NWB4_NEISI|nr:hypothetical protein HMPREF1051_1170 [Neisseria sicca VK64]
MKKSSEIFRRLFICHQIQFSPHHHYASLKRKFLVNNIVD